MQNLWRNTINLSQLLDFEKLKIFQRCFIKFSQLNGSFGITEGQVYSIRLIFNYLFLDIQFYNCMIEVLGENTISRSDCFLLFQKMDPNLSNLCLVFCIIYYFIVFI